MRVNRWVLGLLDDAAYIRLPQTSTHIQLVKFPTISYSRSFFHFLRLPYLQLLPVISQIPGSLTFLLFNRLIASCSRGEGSASIGESNQSQWYPSFEGLPVQVILCGGSCWVNDFLDARVWISVIDKPKLLQANGYQKDDWLRHIASSVSRYLGILF